MGKTKAKKQAMENTMSWKELLDIVNGSCLTGMSKINKLLTKTQVAEIFRNMISERVLNEIPTGTRYSFRKDNIVISKDGLGICNLLREFA